MQQRLAFSLLRVFLLIGFLMPAVVILSQTPTPSPIIGIDYPVGDRSDWTSELIDEYRDEFPKSSDSTGIEAVLVPSGGFSIGIREPPYDDPDETTENLAELNANNFQGKKFYIAERETSNLEYDLDRDPQNPNHPVTGVTWFEAQTFCESKGGRLPTELEWEYAARSPEGLIYPWGNVYNPNNVPNQIVDVFGDSIFEEVSSWVGAFHMVGNVAEWTLSYYQPFPFPVENSSPDAIPEVTPETPFENGNFPRVVRGGDYQTPSANTVLRYGVMPDTSSRLIGFRCYFEYNLGQQ